MVARRKPRRIRRPKDESGQNLVEWARTYPEAKVSRRELLAILSQILGPPTDLEEPKEVEA